MVDQIVWDDEGSDKSHVLDTFQALVAEFQQSQMRSARKAFSNAKAKPDSRVAALFEEKRRHMLFQSLIPSTATLIVVPSVLVEHWKVRVWCIDLYLESYQAYSSHFHLLLYRRRLNSTSICVI